LRITGRKKQNFDFLTVKIVSYIYYYTKSRRSKFIDYQWKHAIVHYPLLMVGGGKNGGVDRRRLAGSMVFTVSLF
jgi:hypothetical protein